MTTFPLWTALVTSLVVGVCVLLSSPWHRRWTADHAGSGVQKQHQGSPSRIGAVPILAGCFAGLGVFATTSGTAALTQEFWFLACALPAALTGLLEDVTKKVRARWRLLAPTVGTVAAIAWLGASIPPLGVPILDALLGYWPIAVLATVLMVVGFTQAMNIVDGLNGLSSGLALMMLLATAWVGHVIGDPFVTRIALLLAASIVGFWVLNFPRGMMFLGDGGAYFIGFSLALLWVLLLVRNPGQVSVWYVMAIAAHPTMETVFSIVRRRFLRARPRPATAPDRLHLHSLMFRRRMRPLLTPAERRTRPWAMNALASAALLAGAGGWIVVASIDPAAHFWNLGVLVLSVVAYLVQFYWITQFKGRRSRTDARARASHVSPAVARDSRFASASALPAGKK